ncbi:TPA: hypothetical protein N0F65_012268 [Lagenidium giganteum]|uniref:protein-serine/threonine phosphatase n=1 Tax=Lagenidium giganteum TaxID=4803 RepID=A0AAV2ZND2_9STRA|nr:TPA: hypothetical protein N0F65_012268 [Lagenidium giganteum]
MAPQAHSPRTAHERTQRASEPQQQVKQEAQQHSINNNMGTGCSRETRNCGSVAVASQSMAQALLDSQGSRRGLHRGLTLRTKAKSDSSMMMLQSGGLASFRKGDHKFLKKVRSAPPKKPMGVQWDKYNPTVLSRDYAAVSTQNSKFRKYMEDECVAIPKYKAFRGDTAKSCFFGVFDGHGGGFCSKYASENFHVTFSRIMNAKVERKHKQAEFELESSNNSETTSSSSTECSDTEPDTLTAEEIAECYTEAFAAIDAELAEHEDAANCGSTAVTCLLRKQGRRTTYHVANVGDSRALLFSNGKTQRITIDHRATNEDEVKRIRASNGIIFNKRVAGMLSVTRALGHADEKEFIINTPHVVSGDIDSDDAFLLLMSDGISDVFTDEEVTEFVNKRLRRGEKSLMICKSLLDTSKSRGAMDNMTAVLISFADQSVAK